MTFTATVAPNTGGGTPTGTVTFTVDGGTGSTAALTNGVATFAVSGSGLTLGANAITAAYNGDPNFAASPTATLTQTVRQPVSLVVTNANDSGPGSLRGVLGQAQNGDTITFIPGFTGTIFLQSLLKITVAVTIVGPGAANATVEGGFSGVIEISANPVTVSGLTITNGNNGFNSSVNNSGNGGGVAIDPGAGLTMSACIITGNSSSNYNTNGGKGGGIYNSGALTLTNCVVSGNSASLGGGLYNNGTATVTNCTFTGNSAQSGNGGGINSQGTLTLTNDIVYADTGGEIGYTTATASYCDIGETLGVNGDGVTDGGGNIDLDPKFVQAYQPSSTSMSGGIPVTTPASENLRLQNPGSPCIGAGTSSGAPATDITGAQRPSPPSMGAYDVNATGTAPTPTPAAGAVTVTSSANPSAVGMPVTFTATVQPNASFTTPTGTVTFTIDGAAGSPLTLNGNGSATVTPSNLSLGTHTVSASYSGDSTYSAATSNTLTQTVRQPNSLVVTNLNDSGTGSLRGVLGQAQGGDTVTFQSGLNGTITLASAITINTSVTITGPGASVIAVSGANAEGVFDITGGTVSISGLTIENGDSYNGGGIETAAGTTLTLTNCTLSHNTGTFGGGLENSGAATVTGCTFTSNTASGGYDAVTISYYGGGGINNGGTLTVTGCTFTGNSAANGAGGGLDNEGTATLTGTYLSGNTGANAGGALYANFGTTTLQNCELADNSASEGGGIADNGRTTLTNCVLLGNTATTYNGGGMQSFSGDVLTNCTLTGNTAPSGHGGGLYFSGTGTLTNDILYGNADGDAVFSPFGTATLTASYCDIGETLGTGTGTDNITDGGHNINANPMFVSSPSDLRLATGSPCIQAGTSSGAPSVDITGAQRPSPPSIGAFDVNATTGTIASAPTTGTGTGTGTGTTTTLTASASTVTVGQSVTFTATVAPTTGSGAPTGTVTFTVDGAAGSPVTLTGGSATDTTSTLAQGTHTVTASYTGTSAYTGSVSSSVSVTVNAASGSGPTLLTTFQAGLQMACFTETYTPFATAFTNETAPAYDTYLSGSGYQTDTGDTSPGHGFWIDPSSTLAVYNTGTPTSGTVTVPLTQGWNLIGDPFSVAFPLADISVGSVTGLTNLNAAGLLYGTLYTWGPSSTAATGYTVVDGTASGASLQPFTGYWLYAFQQGETLTMTQG